jgi:hypothetical protein
MTEHVVHLTKGTNAQEAYDNIIGILARQTIEARTPFGFARHLAPDPTSQHAVCFSEVPVDLLERIAGRRIPDPEGWHGIGFSKISVIERGGGPVFYAYAGTPHEQAARELVRRALTGETPTDDPIWHLTPFIEAPGDYGNSPYYFEWEREWRHVGNFSFEPDEVAFLIMPERLHKAARNFFVEAYTEHTGPAYFCPFLDLTWPRERVDSRLAAGPIAAPTGGPGRGLW